MQVKTYKGYSTYEVLKRIKEEMGDSAIILNTKTEEVSGKKIYTIMAARDLETQKSEESPKHTVKKDETEEKWYQEWTHFKEQIYFLIKNSLDIPSLSSRQKTAIRHLEMEEVGQDFIMNLLVLLKKNGRSFMEILNSMIKVSPWDDSKFPGICHVMVGPHGVGKTTTILKLALKYKRENPSARICLVNVDNYQGKGKLFLKHYAELSDFEYREISGLKETAALLGESTTFDRIFIDTPGLKRGQDIDSWWEESPLKLIENPYVHLVLSPIYSKTQIDHYLSMFLSDKLSSLIWTKLDEACIYGTMLYTAFKTQLPLSLFTYGATLKNSLIPAEYFILWNIVFKHKLP